MEIQHFISISADIFIEHPVDITFTFACKIDEALAINFRSSILLFYSGAASPQVAQYFTGVEILENTFYEFEEIYITYIVLFDGENTSNENFFFFFNLDLNNNFILLNSKENFELASRMNFSGSKINKQVTLNVLCQFYFIEIPYRLPIYDTFLTVQLFPRIS